MSIKTRATIEDLYKVEGKAELVNGEIVHLPPTGDDPGYAGDEILCHCASIVSARRQARHLLTTKGFMSICPIVGF